MSKGVRLLAAALFVASGSFAQEAVKTDSIVGEDDFDFSLTEGQIDEDAEAASTISLVQSLKDPYLSEIGYKWSAMRFKYRSLDNAYVGNYINGIKFNNVENGRFSFSGITGGLNDATRNKTGAGFLDQCNFAYSALGGATDINIRASQFARGQKIGLALTNRNYYVRGTYTFATGMTKSGWALMGNFAYRYSKEGNIEGTFYNSFSFMLGAEKKWNDKHSLAFNIWGTPTERAQQGASTEEAYALAGTHYYNPYWGYQNGKKRNSRVVTEFSPSALLTWDWNINTDAKLSTSVSATWMNYANTALSYNNAYNPRPDYYKNLPSAAFNVYKKEYNNGEWLAENPGILEQYNNLYNYWISAKENRQIKWDQMYAQNEANNTTGKDALYYLEKRHNNQLAFNFSSVLTSKLTKHGGYTLGVNVNSTKGMHYKTMADLLGASVFHDYDNYSLNKYGSKSREYQNDLDNPDRVIGVGDKFGYNYNIYVNKVHGFFNNTWRFGGFTLSYSGDLEGTWMQREGLMRNGRAANYSKGKSGNASFLGGGGKILLSQKIATSTLYVGGSIESQAPLAYNAFIAPRINNNFVNDLKDEWFWNAEAGYQWHFGPFRGKVSGYYTRFNDVIQQRSFYNDGYKFFVYVNMSGIQKEHKGIEASMTLKLSNNLKLNLLGTIADAKYLNNAKAQVAYEGEEATNSMNFMDNKVTGEKMQNVVFLKNVKVGSTPLTAASIGLNYYLKGWYFDVYLNYFDRVYIDASVFNRLTSNQNKDLNSYPSNYSSPNVNTGTITNAWEAAQQEANEGRKAYIYDSQTGEILDFYCSEQEKAKGGFMLDASIGRSIYLRGGKILSINLQVQNITNNTNLKTGGYEQNRLDRGGDYKFTSNNYYYYANAINAFLNVSLKF